MLQHYSEPIIPHKMFNFSIDKNEKNEFVKYSAFNCTEKFDHVCDQCGRKFLSVSTLYQHLEVHTTEKPFVCPQCDNR